ncbi:MAG: S9 family peptidase, partial [FCB group bacterium]|nr:S9 family peptidase [FCB group bacterium]
MRITDNNRNRQLIMVWPKLLLFMVVILLAGICSVAAAGDIYTLEDVARTRWVDGVSVSPDGNNVAYILVVPRDPFEEDDGKAWKELHVSDLDGNSRPFITGKVTIGSIDWTPDGKYISYLAEREDDTNKCLHIIPISGGESQKVIEFPTSVSSYAWSPIDGRVAFLAKDSIVEKIQILQDKGFDQKVYEEDWRQVRLWIYDTNGADDPQPFDLPGSPSSINWSPDGSRLSLALAPTPLIDDRYMYRKICIVDAVSGALLHKLDNPGKLGAMAWSPDSKHLAYITGADENDPSAGELMVASVGDGQVWPVIADFDGHVRDIAWLDGKTIIYRSDEHVHTPVMTIKIDGSSPKTILPAERPVVTDLDLSDNGKIAVFTGSDYNHQWELFYLKVGENKPRRLTNSNPWMDDKRFARQEVIRHNARDGLELEGLLIHPLDEVEGKRYPLILIVHGGPEANRRDGWLTWYSSPGQTAAARGFAVFYPNYRGSTGRGVPFSKMGQADYAGGEFNDLVDAVDHLVEIGLVDKDKVGITGGSYGGYATAWGSTALTEHFAAGVMAVGISDLISKFGTTDIPQEMFLV